MAIIKPFNGIMYNPAKIRDVKTVLAPPYDVISPKMQDDLYELNIYNIVRLILGKIDDKDHEKDNRYTRAKDFLNDWLKNEILVRDSEPCIYVYRQAYTAEGARKVRTGFISLLKIEDGYGKTVLPHEQTLAKPKTDRMNLMKAVNANLSPIFALFSEKSRSVSKILSKFAADNAPVISAEIEGVTHEVWRMSDKKLTGRIVEAMRDKKALIADGHHRYEVARLYRTMMRAEKNYNKNMDYVMVYFMNMEEDESVTIMPTHRMLKDIGGMSPAKFESAIKNVFDVKKAKDLREITRALGQDDSGKRFGVYFGEGVCYVITMKKDMSPAGMIDADKSSDWKTLDVAVLHELLIKKLLSLKDGEDNIKYTRDEKEALKLVDSGDYKIAFLLRPTKAEEVRKIAENGETMPQKSTYFYPKLLSGLVINKF